MIAAIQHLVRSADSAVARVYLSLFRERSALMSFLFHSLFSSEREIARNHINPLERTTVDQFRRCVAYYLEAGYQFVTPDDVLRGLGPDGKYAMLTFDDGYFNNTLALRVLEEFRVPALFFISTDHVRQNKCFWWDVFYRERKAQGATEHQLYRETVGLKGLRTDQIEDRLLDRFGPDALQPRSDIDRPFSPDELRDFARHPYVHLGNHTAAHAILTNYTHGQVREQVSMCQQALVEMTGKAPTTIAYPNGAHDDAVVRICREVGLRMAFTVQPKKNPLPLGPDADLMHLGRFVPHADAPMETQCRTYRSDFLLYGAFRSGYLKLARGQAS